MESKKQSKLVNITTTTKKQTNNYTEQTSGYQWREERGIRNRNTRYKISYKGLPAIKSPPANAGDAGDLSSIPASGRSPGVGNGSMLQYSCLENSMDRETFRATVHGVTKSRTRLRD